MRVFNHVETATARAFAFCRSGGIIAAAADTPVGVGDDVAVLFARHLDIAVVDDHIVVDAPFFSVAVHVEESPVVWTRRADLVLLVCSVYAVPGIFPEHAVVAAAPVPRRPRVVAGRHRAYSSLPHRLRRQVETVRGITSCSADSRVELADRAAVRRRLVAIPRAAEVRVECAHRLHVRLGFHDGCIRILHKRVLPHRHLIDANIVVVRHVSPHRAVLHGVLACRHAPESHLGGLVDLVRIIGNAPLLVCNAARRKVNDHVRASSVFAEVRSYFASRRDRNDPEAHVAEAAPVVFEIADARTAV